MFHFLSSLHTAHQRQIQSLKARVARRDEAIVKLQSQVKSHASRQELETQVGEIVKRHEASKAKVLHPP